MVKVLDDEQKKLLNDFFNSIIDDVISKVKIKGLFDCVGNGFTEIEQKDSEELKIKWTKKIIGGEVFE